MPLETLFSLAFRFRILNYPIKCEHILKKIQEEGGEEKEEREEKKEEKREGEGVERKNLLYRCGVQNETVEF